MDCHLMWQQCVGGRFLGVRSAERHETKECVALGKVVACVNCRGANGAGDQKCPVLERSVGVSRFRVVQKLSYAEAVKKVEENG